MNLAWPAQIEERPLVTGIEGEIHIHADAFVQYPTLLDSLLKVFSRHLMNLFEIISIFTRKNDELMKSNEEQKV